MHTDYMIIVKIEIGTQLYSHYLNDVHLLWQNKTVRPDDHTQISSN